MKVNIILVSFHWLKKNFIKLLIVFYFVIIFILIIADKVCIDFDFNNLLKDNEQINNLLISSFGIGGAVVLYSDYIANKQREAVFGFYANMLVFLKRLDIFLANDFSECAIIVKLYTKGALSANACFEPTEEYLNAFRNLCFEFLNFLSVSKDNIPAKCGNNEFTNWYKSQINIVELLQQGTLFTKSSYGNYSNKDELKQFYDQIKTGIKYLDSIIYNKINEYGDMT